MCWRYTLLLAWVLLGKGVVLGQGQIAQPLYLQTANTWGGRQIQESVPYQPSVLFVQPGGHETPIMLDAMEVPLGTPVLIQETWDNACQDCQVEVSAAPVQLPPGTRGGMFQKLFMTGAWMPQLASDSLGWGDLEAGAVFGLPFLRRDTPLLITPRFAIHALDGPVAPDLPGQVYDADVEFRHLRRFGQGPWAMMAAITFGQYSDFDSGDADAFRITGQAFAVYEKTPGKKWIVGVVYLNREGLRIIPAAGLIYQPDPDTKWEAILPRPRVAWRLPDANVQSDDQRWIYLGGELGGGVWSIRRPLAQMQDVITYNDYRILAGYERKIIGGWSRRFEAGYVFARELQFTSATPDVSLEDSLFMRVGLTY